MSGYFFFDDRERKACDGVFSSQNGVLFAHGFKPFRNNSFQVRDAERGLSQTMMGSEGHASLCSSGTLGLVVALRCVDVNPGDVVAVQAFNFVAVFEALRLIGATPLIIDADLTFNMSAQSLRNELVGQTEAGNVVKAVIATSMLGGLPHIENLQAACTEFNVPLILDACESLGAKWAGSDPATICDITVYSFDFGKTLTCGEGGVVFARDRKVSNLISSFIDHGHENDSSVPRNLDGAAIAGINCRMTELQAAILKVQLSKLDMIVDSYAERFDVLRKHFSNLSVRSEFIESQPLRDNLMVTGLNQSQIKKLTLQLQANGVATKNVPDALRWHSAYHFDHVFPSLSNDPKVRRTHSALLTSLAVNVDPRVSVSDLAKTLAKLDMVC